MIFLGLMQVQSTAPGSIHLQLMQRLPRNWFNKEYLKKGILLLCASMEQVQ
jgi:hypothetical protein